jgi:phosphoribosylformylglycinamidine synthase
MIRATIIVMPKETILDPQGKAIRKALHEHGMACVENARIGKYIDLQISGTDLPLTKKKLESLCSSLLSNPIIEDYTLHIHFEDSTLDTFESISKEHNPQYATRLISRLDSLQSTKTISRKERKTKPKKKGPNMPTKKTTAKKAAVKKPAARKAAPAKKAKAKKPATAKKAKK